jgi:hypothetical protein
MRIRLIYADILMDNEKILDISWETIKYLISFHYPLKYPHKSALSA